MPANNDFLDLDKYYNQLDIGIIILNYQFEIRYINEWFKSRTCNQGENCKSLRDFFGDFDDKYIKGVAEATISTKTNRILSQAFHSWVFPLPDKRFSDNLMRQGASVIPFHDATSGEILALIQVRDDSDRILQIRRLNEEKKMVESANIKLNLAKEEAEFANRAKSDFLASISHEIRTPLNAVIGYSELLGAAEIDPTYRDYVDSIKTSGKSLLTLVNDLLDLSKIDSGKIEIRKEPINPRSIFHQIRKIFAAKIESKRLQFTLAIDPDLPEIIVIDETRFRQVLINLVGNAVKFTDEGFIALSAKWVKCKDNRERSRLEIKLIDSGIGIAEEDLELIFEPFRQSSRQKINKYGGTGLGLTISRKLLDLMDGKLVVASQVGQGTEFMVILDNIESGSENNASDLPIEINLKEISFSPANALIVDDNKSNRFVLGTMLNKVGLIVISAESGFEALELIKVNKIDVIFMDIHMPGMDGFETASKIRNMDEYQNIPIIAVTATDMNYLAKEKEANVFNAIISKPINISGLLRNVSRFLSYTVDNDSEITHQLPMKGDVGFADIVDIEVLIEDLDRNFFPEITEKFQNVIDIQSLVTFSIKLKEKGNQHLSKEIVKIADELGRNASAFNITAINEQFKKLQRLLDSLRQFSKLQSYNKSKPQMDAL